MYECVVIIISIFLNYKLICDLENQKQFSTDVNNEVTLLYSILVCSILLFLQMEPG